MTRNEPIRVRLAAREDLPALKDTFTRLRLDISTGFGAEFGILIVATRGTRVIAGALAQLEAFTTTARFLPFLIEDESFSPETLSALVDHLRMEADFRGWKKLIAFVPAGAPIIPLLRDKGFEPYDKAYLQFFIHCDSAIRPHQTALTH